MALPIKSENWNKLLYKHQEMTHCHIHTETWVQFKLSITLAHFHNAHTGSVILCLYTNTNITHFALRTLAHTPITHTQKAVSKLTLAFLSLSLTKSQRRKEGEEEKKERERWKQNSREGKWGCHQKTKNKKEKKNKAGRVRKNCNLKKVHVRESKREWCAWQKKKQKEGFAESKTVLWGIY